MAPQWKQRTICIAIHLLLYPASKYRDVALHYQCKYQQVQQIAHRIGVTKIRSFTIKCKNCGIARKITRSELERHKTTYCKHCYQKSVRAAANVITLTCDICGNVFTLSGKAASNWKRNHKIGSKLAWCRSCSSRRGINVVERASA